ncbi:2235_t:CDS:1, partial [Racocetra fulgida]
NVLVSKSVNLDYPLLPSSDSRDPTEWGKHRQNLIKYIEDLQYFGHLFNDLEFMKNLFRTYKKDEDIIKDFIKSFEYDINRTYTVKQKKNQRYKNYATNLLRSFKKINNENERKEFFINARFSISTLYDQDIDPIINEFLKKK